MKTTQNQLPNLVNKSAIARQAGFSPQYVGQLLRGKRKNRKALNKVLSVINKHIKDNVAV